MLGVWMWAVGEAIWYYYYLTVGEVPSPSLSDLAWTIGYVFFTIAFYNQYKIFFRPKENLARGIALATWAATLLAAALLYWAFGQPGSGAYLDYFYPVADFAFGVFAVHTLWIFRGGALARPWLGLFVFTFSDAAYTWAEQSGLYAWSVSTGNPLSLAVDLAYLAAYLILAIGLLGQYVLVHYDAYSFGDPDKPQNT